MTKSKIVSKAPLKGIVFDLDGTLVDSLSVTFEAFNHGITQNGGPWHTPEEIMKHFGSGEDKIFEKIIGKEKAEAAYEVFRNHMDSNLTQVPMHEGVGTLLERLKSDAVPISIFTGRSWRTTEMILKHHRLLDRFITVVANDHVDEPKPSPEGLNLALSRMKLAPNEALFVGDSTVDILAAHSAGSVGVAALWDMLAKREELELIKPHHWAENPGRVWEIWESRV